MEWSNIKLNIQVIPCLMLNIALGIGLTTFSNFLSCFFFYEIIVFCERGVGDMGGGYGYYSYSIS